MNAYLEKSATLHGDSSAAHRQISSTRLIPGVPVILTLLALCLAPALSAAATRVFIHNNTGIDIEVISVSVDGDKLSRKAWKQGQSNIPAGQRVSVLSINRTGKFNWMDPTPRFIEPGKTAIFTVQVRSGQSDMPLTIKQKLLGTGSTSKLWYAIGTSDGFPVWQLPYGKIAGQWLSGAATPLNYQYHAVATDTDDDLELIVQN